MTKPKEKTAAPAPQIFTTPPEPPERGEVPKGYHLDMYGILTQDDLTVTASYDEKYLTKYDKCPCEKMAELRYRLIRNLPLVSGSIFDVGYGRGHLLRLCQKRGMLAVGHDITYYKIPDADITYSDLWGMNIDVMTFFDSLEHFPDLTFLRDITAKQVIVSVPWLPSWPAAKLAKWRHWRPGEHLRHFTPYSLRNLFFDIGYRLVCYGNPEDEIRTADHSPNILTAAFIRSELLPPPQPQALP
jgi:hypothetical protein